MWWRPRTCISSTGRRLKQKNSAPRTLFFLHFFSQSNTHAFTAAYLWWTSNSEITKTWLTCGNRHDSQKERKQPNSNTEHAVSPEPSEKTSVFYTLFWSLWSLVLAMSVSSLFLSGIAVLSLLGGAQAGIKYTLDVEYSGDNFFDGFSFFQGADPTHGFVKLVFASFKMWM
jgi:hypothetical protein